MRIVDMRPAFNATRARTKPVRAIVVHHTQTKTPEGTRRVLRENGLSTHAEIDTDGTVYLYVDTDRVAFHGGHVNDFSIGLDFTHMAGEPFTKEQIEAGRELIHDWADHYAIPLKVPPDRCKGDPRGSCKPPESGKVLVGWGYGVLRHRDFYRTICPDELDVEKMIGSGVGIGGLVVVGALTIAGIAGGVWWSTRR